MAKSEGQSRNVGRSGDFYVVDGDLVPVPGSVELANDCHNESDGRFCGEGDGGGGGGGFFDKVKKAYEKSSLPKIISDNVSDFKEAWKSSGQIKSTVNRAPTTVNNNPSRGLFNGKPVVIDGGSLSKRREATQAEVDRERDLIAQKAREAGKSSWTHSQDSLDRARVESEVRARNLLEGKIATKKDVRKAIDRFRIDKTRGFWGLVGIGVAVNWIKD